MAFLTLFASGPGICAILPFPLSPFLLLIFVILAKAGIHGIRTILWIPTFVGMTERERRNDRKGVGMSTPA